MSSPVILNDQNLEFICCEFKKVSIVCCCLNLRIGSIIFGVLSVLIDLGISVVSLIFIPAYISLGWSIQNFLRVITTLTILYFLIKNDFQKDILKIHLLIAVLKWLMYINIVCSLILSVSMSLNYESVFVQREFDFFGFSLMEVLFMFLSINIGLFSFNINCLLYFYSYGYSSTWIDAGLIIYNQITSTHSDNI